MDNTVSGFSKKTKTQKIDWLLKHHLGQVPEARSVLTQYWNNNEQLQALHDEFIENSLTNFYLPYGVAPNFLINGKVYTIPMVIEESSVVAAASNAAKFWLDKGGFSAEVLSTVKTGQIHLHYSGNTEVLIGFYERNQQALIDSVADIQQNMQKRGGGLLSLELIDSTEQLEGFFVT